MRKYLKIPAEKKKTCLLVSLASAAIGNPNPKGNLRLMTRLFAILSCLTTFVQAELRLPRIFTDHMVLQQEQPIAVWGWDKPTTKVTVTLAETSVSTVTKDDGTWRIDLPSRKADGKRHTLQVKGSSDIRYSDVVVGEVWLVSGQSNMNRGVKIIDFSDPDLRLFWVDFNTTPNAEDLNQGVAGWTPSTAKDLAEANPPSEGRFKGKTRTQFSEVGYVFAQELRKQLKVPVGVIKATVGGSTAKAWTPQPQEYPSEHPWGVEIEKVRYIAHKPGLLYHCMIDGLVPFSMRGAIWYQGEDDGRNKSYATDLTTLIKSYRSLWDNDRFAFHMVQIAQTTYASGMLGVYEAQVAVSNALPHCGLAPSNTLQDKSMRADEGDRKRNIPGTGWPLVAGSNPHPPNKHIVARRLADIALKQTYARLQHEVLGPTFKSHEVKDDKVRVTFQHAGSGLGSDDGKALNWFELSDGTPRDDRKNSQIIYHPAKAKIVAPDTIEVSSSKVANPKHVRFAWHPLARHNLTNKEGLPALPFRSDRLPQMWNRR